MTKTNMKTTKSYGSSIKVFFFVCVGPGRNTVIQLKDKQTIN